VPGVGGYAPALKADALKGARIGVARKQYFGYSDVTDAVINAAIADMKAHGAVIVDPADIPTASKMDACEMEVLLYEFKADLNTYLAARGPSSSARSLQDIIAFNEREKAREMPYFGQELFLRAQKKGPLTSPAYLTAKATCRSLAREQGIDLVLRKYRLDAIVAPTGSPAWTTDLVNGDHFTGASSTPAAVAGYPSISVTAGQAFGLPVGISFIGTAWVRSETDWTGVCLRAGDETSKTADASSKRGRTPMNCATRSCAAFAGPSRSFLG